MKKINSELFKKSLSKFATGITIVTINKNGNYIGKTVNSFSSLSLKPHLVLFSLDKKSSSIKDYKNSSNIGINILSKKQVKISEYFSQKKVKWNLKNYFITKNNIPMIQNCIANFNCKKIEIINSGDHIIFICKVIEVKIDEKHKPLIYFNSKYF